MRPRKRSPCTANTSALQSVTKYRKVQTSVLSTYDEVRAVGHKAARPNVHERVRQAVPLRKHSHCGTQVIQSRYQVRNNSSKTAVQAFRIPLLTRERLLKQGALVRDVSEHRSMLIRCQGTPCES